MTTWVKLVPECIRFPCQCTANQ